jgi:CHAD domain-containing protein
MSLDRKHIRPTFRKLGRQLSKLASRPAPERVHKFRTSSRRIEVLMEEFSARLRRNDKKLLKLLSRLRKKAGRVRDLDVQASALRSLKIPQEPARKSQLMRTLAEERAKREKKFNKALDRKAAAELRRRLKRCAATLDIPRNADPLALALRKVTELELDSGPVAEKTLHRFRIAGKRARYVAEFADRTAERARLIEQLKHMQDVIGDWHDWLQLTEKAEQLFGDVPGSALVAALHNLTRAKFRQAVSALAETRGALIDKKPVPVAPRRHPYAQQGSLETAAVA